jgi:hypothetical protein
MALEKFQHSPLPLPTQEYDQNYMVQLVRTLETYLNQLDSKTPNHADSYRALQFYGGTFTGDTASATSGDINVLEAYTADLALADAQRLDATYIDTTALQATNGLFSDATVGNMYASTLYGSGVGIDVPHGKFGSVVAQTAAATTSAYVVGLDTTETAFGVSVVSGTRITFVTAGVYRMEYSLQIESDSTATEEIDVWLRKNGTNIVLSNRKFGAAARKDASNPYHDAKTAFIAVTVAADDYVELVWHVTDTAVSIQPYATSTTPDVPTTPAVVVSVVFVSAAPVTDSRVVAPLPAYSFGAVGDVSISTS